MSNVILKKGRTLPTSTQLHKMIKKFYFYQFDLIWLFDLKQCSGCYHLP